MKPQRFFLLSLIFVFSIEILFSVDKKWEIDVHYSSWSINFISSTVIGALENAIDDYDSNNGELTFNSHGNNIGIGIRYFPAGKTGSLSFGFSHERNHFKINLTGKYLKTDSLGQKMVFDGKGNIELNPHSFNVGIRWEMFPMFKIHPYFGFGVGFGIFAGSFEANVVSVTTLYNGQTVEKSEYDESYSLNELVNEYEKDGHSIPIGFIPFFQIQLGVRGEVAKDTYFLAEVQFYNGISFRGSVSYRF